MRSRVRVFVLSEEGSLGRIHHNQLLGEREGFFQLPNLMPNEALHHAPLHIACLYHQRNAWRGRDGREAEYDVVGRRQQVGEVGRRQLDDFIHAQTRFRERPAIGGERAVDFGSPLAGWVALGV